MLSLLEIRRGEEEPQKGGEGAEENMSAAADEKDIERK